MLRPGLSRFLPLRRIISSSSHAAAAVPFSSLSNSNFRRSNASSVPHEGHEVREAPLWFFSRSENGSLGFCRAFSVSRMELKEFLVSGTEETIEEAEYIEYVPEADDLSGGETLTSLLEEDVHSDTSDDERFSCVSSVCCF